jgi:hypothetical protein
MRDIKRLLESIAGEEQQSQSRSFLAPCVRGGKVRARVAGLVQTFLPRPRHFEGWGIFQPIDPRNAKVIAEAELPLVAEYMKLLRPLRLRLVCAMRGQTWLAYPVNESDARQRLGEARPLMAHLVTEGAVFEQIVARGDGVAWWFEEVDRRADPLEAERLRDALRNRVMPEEARFSGITPEMRTAYDLAAQQSEQMRPILEQRRAEREAQARREQQERYQQIAQEIEEETARGNVTPPREHRTQRRGDQARLDQALQMAGGSLQSYSDRGEYWLVEWMTRDGQRHTSAIGKEDLTVISSGVCLSGRDNDFDLQSLVGVIEKGDW